MGIDPRHQTSNDKTSQFLSGFIYSDKGQAEQLSDGTFVRGRCQTPGRCVNVTSYIDPRDGGTISAGDNLELYYETSFTEPTCTGVCLEVRIVESPDPDNPGETITTTEFTGEWDELAQNATECANTIVIGMLDDTKPVWHDWQWLDPVVRPGIEDQFDCLNDSENNNWISYPNSKYAESAFLPAEEWRKQIGWNWGNVGSMSIDGLTVPTSTQFRRTIGACIRNYCNDSQFKTKAACTAAGKQWKAEKILGGCFNSDGTLFPEYKTENACVSTMLSDDSGSNPEPGNWQAADYSSTCLDAGGCWLEDAGDEFDKEVPQGFLPSYYSPNVSNLVGSGEPTSVTLNPYASGHNVSVMSRNKRIKGLVDATIRKADHGEKVSQLGIEPTPSDDSASNRPVALRGPLVLAGWGYDDLNQPVPNEYYDADEFTVDSDGQTQPVYAGHCDQAGKCSNDSYNTQQECVAATPPGEWDAYSTKEDCLAGGSCDPKGLCTGGSFVPIPTNQNECDGQGGIWIPYYNEEICNLNGGNWTVGSWKGVPQNKNPELHFYFNHLKRPDKWKVGPVDLRWDRERKVWVPASPLKISLCKATRCILPQAGSDGKNSFNFGILDNINAPGRLYRNPCSWQDCDFGTYFPKSVMYPDIEIYDPEDYEWCGNCKVKKDAGGKYYVTCEDFHSTCVPFYDAIVIRDMKHYVFGGDRSAMGGGHHHDATGGDTDCGDKFSKTHRGDPYNRRMGNPCHEFGNSIESEQIPLSANSKYPREAKSVLYQRVLIENPLGQGLMIGDSFLSADTGKRITIEYVRKKEGTGSSNCTGANASPETVKESLPVHIILQGEFYGQEILTSMGCEQGEASACSKKIMVQGMTTMEDCGPNDDYPQSSTAY